MKTRTLKLNEIVYVICDYTCDVMKGRITAIDFKQRDYTFSDNQINVDVEIEITEPIMAVDYNVGEHMHVNNQEVYQIVPGKHYNGEEVCYETREDYLSYGKYFTPMEDVNFNENEFDENNRH